MAFLFAPLPLPAGVVLAIASLSASHAEGSTGGLTPYSFAITRQGDTTGTVSVDWSVSGSGPSPAIASDFEGALLPSGTVTFKPGDTSVQVTINVNADTTPEATKGFMVSLANPVVTSTPPLTTPVPVTITVASAEGSIVNDDGTTLAITANVPGRSEGSNGGFTPFTFKVERSGNLAAQGTVAWSVSGSGARPAIASDFQGDSFPSGVVTFLPGQASALISINVKADQVLEPNEDFVVTLANPSAGVIVAAKALAKILNDDGATFEILAPNAPQLEGSSGGLTAFTFTVVRSGVTSGPARVSWSVVGGAGNPANAADFEGGRLPSGLISFRAGERVRQITIQVNADRTIEADETFKVQLSNPVGASITTATAQATVRSDDHGLTPRGDRLTQLGRWQDTLDPRVQHAIVASQRPLSQTVAAPAVDRWVIAGPVGSPTFNLESFLSSNSLQTAADISIVYNLPGIRFLSLLPGDPLAFDSIRRKAEASGYLLWYEVLEKGEVDAPVVASSITEPAFTGTVSVAGVANASLIHLQASNLSNPASPSYGLNVVGAWPLVGGQNINVAVNDTLFDLFHPDLIGQMFNANVDLDGDGVNDFGDANSDLVPDIFAAQIVTEPPGSLNWRANNTNATSDEHGTAVSGIILAATDGTNAVGVAPQSRWIPDSGMDTSFSLATRSLANIINNSWGSSGRRGFVVPAATSVQNWRNAWLESANHPAISHLVNSAGNGRARQGTALWQNTNTREFNPFRQVISVAAAQRSGDIEAYSTPGTAVLVAAPVNSNLGYGTLTSDVTDDPANNLDDRGYVNGNMTPFFAGTSSAAPMVSGVIALMLEANPTLSLRDIQHILVRTAQKNRLRDSDSDGLLDAVVAGGTTELRTSFVATANTDGLASQDPYNTGWFLNGAGHWVSDSFGFGIVDAAAAVAMAASWIPVEEELELNLPAILTAAPVTVAAGSVGALNSLPSLGSWAVDSNLRVEWVEVTVDLNVSDVTDLMLVLVSPSGTRSVLLAPGGGALPTGGESLSFNGTRTLISNQFWDESARGMWSIESIDTQNPSNVQTIANASLAIYGTCIDSSPLSVTPFQDLSVVLPGAPLTTLAGEFLELGGARSGQYNILSTSSIGSDAAWGRFSGGLDSKLNLDEGFIFTSGNAVDAIGPNHNPDTTTNHNAAGHWITDQLVSASTFDAGGFQVVFSPTQDINLQWGFQFGSEEFFEWVGSQFNDSAGIFIAELNDKNMQAALSGQPFGGLVNLTENAFVEVGGATSSGSVTVNTLSNGKSRLFSNSICDDMGWEYDGGSLSRLHSRVAPLRAGKQYILYALTADTSDRLYDSGLIAGASTVPHILLRTNTPSVLEDGAANLEFLFERTGPLADALTVSYTVAGTANLLNDYSGIATAGSTKTITFLPGMSSVKLVVDPTADTAVELDETITLALAGGLGYTNVTTDPVTGTIVNDDTSLSVRAVATAIAEGSNGLLTPFNFTILREGNLSGPSSVQWSVASAGVIPAIAADFQGGVFPSGTASFLPGQNSTTITVNVNADVLVESNESFLVQLANPVGALISAAAPRAVARINNDDGTSLAITAANASAAEGNSGGLTPFNFLVTRTGNTALASSASWSVAGASLTPASALDFSGGVFPTGTVSFLAGQVTRTITVNVAADLLQEDNEAFAVTLAGAVGATITTSKAEATITNDDYVGTVNSDVILGSILSDYINGMAANDVMTGGAAADLFGFQYGHSSITAPDRITDFSFGSDQIDLFSSAGAALPAPPTFARAADNSLAATLSDLSIAVFADSNGALAGNQPLAANAAALVVASHPNIAGTYLLINNAVATRSATADLLVNLTGYSGTLPGLGSIVPAQVFA